MPQHLAGLLITAAGVVILSPDATLVRLVDGGTWMTVAWRGYLTFIGLAAALTLVYGGRPATAVRAIGAWGLLSSLCFGLNTTLFVYSIDHTAAANTLVIIAGGPLFGAIFSRALLGEHVAVETWVATILVVAGLGVVVWDGVLQGTWRGDVAAVVTALSLSANFVIMRHRKDVSMVPATALGGLWSALGATAAVLLGAGGGTLTPAPGDLAPLLLMGLVVLPGAFGLITLGPRYITAPEVGLLMLLETMLGPLWVWLVTGEIASATSLTAGAFVVVTLVVYFTVRLRRQRTHAPRPA